MPTYHVELFGMSNQVVGLREVEVELDDVACLEDVVAALRRTMPALEGSVILPGKDRLAKHYTFNVNGRFHLDDYAVKVHQGDHIVLLTFALGG